MTGSSMEMKLQKYFGVCLLRVIFVRVKNSPRAADQKMTKIFGCKMGSKQGQIGANQGHSSAIPVHFSAFCAHF